MARRTRSNNRGDSEGAEPARYGARFSRTQKTRWGKTEGVLATDVIER
jgi:hypothetical protein